jgi:hypothetical protein
MITPFWKAPGKVVPPVVVVLLVFAFSSFHAQTISDRTIRREIAPPPHYRTRFVLYPNRHIEGVDELGFKPGWVVTCAPRSKTYGTAFYVSFFGKILTRGTPSLVGKQHQQAHESVEKFQTAFAQLDIAVPLGSTFSNALAVLGKPILTKTNNYGSLRTYFDYMPRAENS